MSCIGYYCSKDKPNQYNPSWMKNITDRSISTITFPGTHDTCCRKTWEIAECQSWTIEDQLKAGIRYVDIRCRHIHNIFTIHHGIVYCKIVFSEVLDIVKNFLKENPSECILMRVKEEYNPEGNTRSFQDTFSEYLKHYNDILYMESHIPNLDEVRGKIVVLVDFRYDKGLSYNTANIQDYWQVNTIFDLPKKKKAVKEHLDKAIKGDPFTLYLNHLTAAGWGCYPFTVARSTNDIPLKYEGRMGIIVCDYPGENLIEHLIKQNK